MSGATKAHSLDGEFLANEIVQVDPGNDYVSPQHTGGFVLDAEVFYQPFENFGREKGDLSLVVVPVIIEPVAADSVAGDALDSFNFDERVIVGRLAVVPKVVMTR